MAFHPFRTFQRNQKGCMAGATLLAIISFLFLGVIIQLIGSRGGPSSQITTYAESRRFGKITDYEVQRLRDDREMLGRFFNVLLRNLWEASDPTNPEMRESLLPLQMLVHRFEQPHHPEQLINDWLISQYAKDEGVSPDWHDMLRWLKEQTGDYLSDAVYSNTLRSVGLSQQSLEYLLARYLRQQQLLAQFNLSVSVVSPATRWDWFQRLHRQVTIETAAVPVDSFVNQVGEPSASQLNAFFEQRKGKRFNPMVADSGFIMPTKLAFQYAIAEPSQALLDSITEEEMLAYYEEHKETLFRKQPAGAILDSPQFPGLPGTMPGLPGAMPFPTPGRSLFPMPTAPMPEDLDGNREPTTGSPNDSSPSGDAPVIEGTPQTDEPAPVEAAPVEEVPRSEEATPTTSAVSRVSMRFVSYQTDEAEQAGETAETSAEAPEAVVGEAPPTTLVMPREINQDEEFVMPALSEPKEAEDEVIDLSILYRPFDDVKEEIRQTLAGEKALAALSVIQAKMKEYTDTYHTHFEQNKPIPPMPDLTGFAAEQRLELKTVPLGDVYAALRTEFGFRERGLLGQLYSRTPLLFEAEIASGNSTQVLYWVTEQEEEKRPKTMSEVQEIVLQRWKEVEARTLALAKAEELAKAAKASEKPLVEVFADHAEMLVVETEPFTWKTYGNMPPMLALYQALYQGRLPTPVVSEIREKGVPVGDAEMLNRVIAAPGSDFMETVFSLQIGETDVAFNQPQSAAHIVRVTSSSPSTEALWEQFQTTDTRIYLNAGFPEVTSTAFEAWLGEIQKKTGFRWLNRPDAQGWERYSDD